MQDLHRQENVVDDGPPLQENRLLKDHSHLPGGIEIPFRGKRQVAVRFGQEAGDDLQKRRLPAPGRPHEGDELSAVDIESHILKGADFAGLGGINLSQVPNIDKRFSFVHERPMFTSGDHREEEYNIKRYLMQFKKCQLAVQNLYVFFGPLPF